MLQEGLGTGPPSPNLSPSLRTAAVTLHEHRWVSLGAGSPDELPSRP